MSPCHKIAKISSCRDPYKLWSVYTWHTSMVQQPVGGGFRPGEDKTTLHFGWSLCTYATALVLYLGAWWRPAFSHRRHTSLCSVIGWSPRVDDKLLKKTEKTHICRPNAWFIVLCSVNFTSSPFFSF